MYGPPSTIKLHVAGNGRAKKWQIKRAVENHLGIKTEDENAADALAVWLWAKGLPEAARSEQKPKAKPKRKRTAKAGRLF